MPYAEALAKNEAEINLCPPGGIEGLFAIAKLLNKDASPFVPAMEQKTKSPSIAVIREAECIGCTKCIQACPVDAILGTAKQMHTVISAECTGCELCIAPCPVDCIDMMVLPQIDHPTKTQRAKQYRHRYHARELRLQQQKQTQPMATRTNEKTTSAEDKKAYITAALSRTKAKQAKKPYSF